MIYTNDEIVFRTCQVLVRLFRNHLEEGRKDKMHSRIFERVLHPEEDYVFAGVSKNVSSSSQNHPEHVVPCAFMQSEVIRLLENGVLSEDEIAALLQKHCPVANWLTSPNLPL